MKVLFFLSSKIYDKMSIIWGCPNFWFSMFWKIYVSICLIKRFNDFSRDQKAMISQLESECHNMAENIEVAKTYANMVHIVRYEDIALDPVTETRKIYDFLAMEIPSEVENFLEIATKNDDKTKYEKGQEYMKIYSTTRKSSENLQKWRMKADFFLTEQVQSKCGEMMKKFKYKTFTNIEELRNISLAYF